MPNSGQMFTVTSAAAACLVNQKTIRRRLDQLEEHGAFRAPDGQWSIPLESLLAVGLQPGRPAGPDSPVGQPGVSRGAVHSQIMPLTPASGPPTAADALDPASAEVLAELVELRRQAELDNLRRRAELAEARLEEQTRLLAERAEVVQILRMALRQLEAAPTPTPSGTPPASPPPASPPPASPPPAEPVAVTPVPAAAAVPAPPAGGAPEPAALPAPHRRWWQSRR